MLPDIRAVFAAVIAAIGVLVLSFGLVAVFRVAQDSRSGSLQADLAQRGRAPLIANPRAVLIIDTPAQAEFVPVVAATQVSVTAQAPDVEAPVAPASAALAEPQAEPPMGGPLPEQTAGIHLPRDAAAEMAAGNEKKAAAKKVRAARIARQRKAAARRAAQARRAQENSAASFGNLSGQ